MQIKSDKIITKTETLKAYLREMIEKLMKSNCNCSRKWQILYMLQRSFPMKIKFNVVTPISSICYNSILLIHSTLGNIVSFQSFSEIWGDGIIPVNTTQSINEGIHWGVRHHTHPTMPNQGVPLG